MIIPDVGEINTDIELLTPQTHENVAIIPLKTAPNYKLDLLTLKKGLELGLVEVKECAQSTVNTLMVKNKSVAPLILIDGEEVVGGDQNRLMNSTIIVAPQSESKISVSCTERGRWGYLSKFKSSEHIANFRTRRAKAYAIHEEAPVQNAVWSSIDVLEQNNKFSSPTSAMNDSYEHEKVNLNAALHSFKIVDGQNGVLIIVNGEIKGFELFLNPEIYKEFHGKILKSYLIDAEVKTTTFPINIDEAKLLIDNALDSNFESKENIGLEKRFEFESCDGLGNLYIYENEIIHMSYFKKDNEAEITDEVNEDIELKSNI